MKIKIIVNLFAIKAKTIALNLYFFLKSTINRYMAKLRQLQFCP